MFPSEILILIATAVARDSGKKLLTYPMDVTDEYSGYLYDSLVKRGYLEENGSTGYQLTSKGSKALFKFLQKNKTRIQDMINTFKQLDIEIGQEIDKLEKEAIEVK